MQKGELYKNTESINFLLPNWSMNIHKSAELSMGDVKLYYRCNLYREVIFDRVAHFEFDNIS